MTQLEATRDEYEAAMARLSDRRDEFEEACAQADVEPSPRNVETFLRYGWITR